MRERTRRRRRDIQKQFSLRRYRLKAEALDMIENFPDEDIELLLNRLQQESRSSTLDVETIRNVIEEAATDESTTSVYSLAVIDNVFLVPKFRYDVVNKRFIEHESNLPVHGEASAKTYIYRERFRLLSQRVSRADSFSRPVFDADMLQYKKREISSIQSLAVEMGKKWVMGLILQMEDGHFYLEDLSASVEIDLSKAKITTGFFTENTIILAQGEMHNGIFQVIACGFPPLEDRDKTLRIHRDNDFFGCGRPTKHEMIRLADLDRLPVNDTFVILSEIWLDDEEVLGKLETVLHRFESVETVPSLFVFMGNFCSRPCNLSFGSYSSLRQQFGKLGRMIGNHPKLKANSRFLFIPGPHDAGPSTVLPRCGLPEYLTEELREVIPNAIFSSNPCRVKFDNKEIVFFRQDLLYRMSRSCLITPSSEETTDPFEHLVSTLIHQSHLCPLPLLVQPIIWNYDHCLKLYPTPHTIVLGDKSEQKDCRIGGAKCFNPGSFSTDSTYVVYRPSTQEIDTRPFRQQT
ncbi:PREDICTED: DNA polymerase epsilon subunit B-like [Camelina sativa]|uniref:DNA polymerase epsilon subunit n=1 Tax=Camelina sativa TaxID=90675 RepID=A0ABM0T063_CAMSA|nr:PREDICTED: DNA polymerase epsilon subunit B-like [Camelina sativa]